MALSDKDLTLKLATAALFRRMGFVVFHEVELNSYSYQGKYSRKQISDFDVLGVRFDFDLQDYIAVAECKSMDDSAMEHLLKLNGLTGVFDAHKSYLVQRKIDDNAREVGKELGVYCIDERNLAALLRSFGVSDGALSFETRLYEAKFKAREVQKSDFPTQLSYVRTDFWMLPPHRNLINLLHLFQSMGGKPENAKWQNLILAQQMCVLFSLSLLRLCAQITRHNVDQILDGLLTSLMGGSRERRDREALFDEIAKHLPDAGLTARPPFFEPLAELVNRISQAFDSSYHIVGCMDSFLTRAALEEHHRSGEDFPRYSERTVKLTRDVLRFIQAQAGLDKAVFSTFMIDQTSQ